MRRIGLAVGIALAIATVGGLPQPGSLATVARGAAPDGPADASPTLGSLAATVSRLTASGFRCSRADTGADRHVPCVERGADGTDLLVNLGDEARSDGLRWINARIAPYTTLDDLFDRPSWVGLLATMEALVPSSGAHVLDVLGAGESVDDESSPDGAQLIVQHSRVPRYLFILLLAQTPSTDPSPGPAPALRDLVTSIAGDGARAMGSLDEFWSGAIEIFGGAVAYEPPAAVLAYPTGTVPDTGCKTGRLPHHYANNAVYCGKDGTVAFDQDFLQVLHDDVGEFAPLIILAHEWGHHLQRLAGMPLEGLQQELQADCLAGLFFRKVYGDDDRQRRAMLYFLREARRSPSDIVEGGATQDRPLRELQDAWSALYDAGNDRFAYSTWLDRNQHGSQAGRTEAFAAGWRASAYWPVCVGYASYLPRNYVDLGTYRFLNIPGMLGRGDSYGGYVIDAKQASMELYPVAMKGDRRSAEELLLEVMSDFGPDRFDYWYGPLPRDPGALGGQLAVVDYELSHPNEETAYAHGTAAAHVPSQGDIALMIDMWRPGPWPKPANDEAAWNAELGGFRAGLLLAIGRLCAPGNSAVQGMADFNVACVEDQ